MVLNYGWVFLVICFKLIVLILKFNCRKHWVVSLTIRLLDWLKFWQNKFFNFILWHFQPSPFRKIASINIQLGKISTTIMEKLYNSNETHCSNSCRNYYSSCLCSSSSNSTKRYPFNLRHRTHYLQASHNCWKSSWSFAYMVFAYTFSIKAKNMPIMID